MVDLCICMIPMDKTEPSAATCESEYRVYNWEYFNDACIFRMYFILMVSY